MTYSDDSGMRIIFVGGIHGSGKTTLCQRLASSLGAPHYSAGDLIRLGGVQQDERKKAVEDVPLNQRLLLEAVDRIRGSGTGTMLLDGHYTVVEKEDRVCAVAVEIFRALSPAVLLLVEAEPNVVARRLRERDHRTYELALIEKHGRAERAHANHISEMLRIPLMVVSSLDDADDVAHLLISTNASLPGG